jgi:hypothetical protein
MSFTMVLFVPILVLVIGMTESRTKEENEEEKKT